MKLCVFDDIPQCTEADVNRLLPLVSPLRREQALRYKHTFGRWACLKSYECLMTLLGDTPDAMASRQVLFNECGKPRFADGPCFSISHCKHAIAVVTDSLEIGIDIESIRRADRALVERTMNADERRAIAEDSCPDRMFTSLWTRKEAVLKYRGTGIIDNLQDVLLPDTLTDIELLTTVTDTYVYTIARRLTHG